MATSGKDLSSYDKTEFQHLADARVGIVVSEWNDEITNSLLEGAHHALIDCGLDADSIVIERVPGSYELPLGAQLLLEGDNSLEGVICLGSVIRGETAHFDFVCEACAQGVKDVGLKFSKPVMFGVLTDDHIDQSRARSGGKHGNKGTEAAIAALKMISLRRKQLS